MPTLHEGNYLTFLEKLPHLFSFFADLLNVLNCDKISIQVIGKVEVRLVVVVVVVVVIVVVVAAAAAVVVVVLLPI